MQILPYIIIISRYVFYVSAVLLIVLKVFSSIQWMTNQSKNNCQNKESKRFVIQTLILCIVFLASSIGLQTQFSKDSTSIQGVCVIIAFVSGFFLIFDWESRKIYQHKTPMNKLISISACIASISLGIGVFTEVTLFLLALVIIWFIGNSILYFFHRKKTKICKYGEKYYITRYKWLEGWVWIKPDEISVESKLPDTTSIQQYLCENIEDAKKIVAKVQNKT